MTNLISVLSVVEMFYLTGQTAANSSVKHVCIIGMNSWFYGMQRNQEAADRMYEYLEIQDNRKLPTSMADIQSRYSAIPYGWREIDIAAVAAKLIVDQRVTIKYAGTTIQPDNPKLPDMLRKKSEIGKTVISKRHVLSLQKMKQAREFVREFFEVMDIPADEDGLIRFIVDRFTQLRKHYEDMNERYDPATRTYTVQWTWVYWQEAL